MAVNSAGHARRVRRRISCSETDGLPKCSGNQDISHSRTVANEFTTISASFETLPPATQGSGADGEFRIQVERSSLLEAFAVAISVTVTMAIGVALVIFVIGFLLHDEAANSSYKLWLLFALMAPLTFAYQKVVGRVGQYYEEFWWVRIEVDSMRSSSLYNAVANEIEKVAEQRNSTCSSDAVSYTHPTLPTILLV